MLRFDNLFLCSSASRGSFDTIRTVNTRKFSSCLWMFLIISVYTSILTLTMIAIIRCVKITRSENIYTKLFTKLKITLIIIGIWVLVGAICVPLYSIDESLWFIYDSKIKMYKPKLLNSPGNWLSVFILAIDTIYFGGLHFGDIDLLY